MNHIRLAGIAGRVFISILFALCIPRDSNATHIIAGEITYRSLNYLTYQATVVMYTDDASFVPTDTIRLRWGDNSEEVIRRSNGNGERLPNGILKSVYISSSHTYAGVLPFYIISVLHFNRINNIININNGASVLIPLYMEDTLRIFDPVFLGSNSSPVLLSLPIDYANVNDTFFHNPIAFDLDGDSLVFSLEPPKMDKGAFVPAYRYPDEVNPGPLNQFTINSRTGEIIWATPKRPGIYNIAIIVTEYRNDIKIGTVLRDMQIRVGTYNNNSPQISRLSDTCIVAGSFLTKTITARDVNAGQLVTLTAEGGPLRLPESPASFTTPAPVGNPVSGIFNWLTTCDHIRPQFFQVVFKAVDNFNPPLVDLETWVIKVVAPAPENLTALATGNQINLAWDEPYQCSAFRNFIGFSVWRREGSNPFAVDVCETGLAGKGYARIAQFITDYAYNDTDVQRGKQYCYRILAEFAERTQGGLFYNRVESLPSNEACDELQLNVPLIKKASVLETSATDGRIDVAWYRPKTGPGQLDTTQLTGPYTYTLLRSTGFDGGNFAPIATFSNQYFAELVDTAFSDNQLNTVDNPYTYRVDFYSNGDLLMGSSETASSVFLSITPGSMKLELTWEERVPWLNYSYVIYRQNGTVFDSITTVSQPYYKDHGLLNDKEYCYYVKSIGEYTSAFLSDTLFNLSQRTCASPVDLDPPCPPKLQVISPCAGENPKDVCIIEGEIFNELKWTDDKSPGCDEDIAYYNIYFAAHAQAALAKAGSGNELFLLHSNGNSLAGCYAVTAVDSSGNESALSNKVCVDNCPCYRLPNVFTPNNDGRNDFFIPIAPYRFVEKIDMKIYNRWGTLVFETADPDIRWDGTDINNGKAVKEGVYYYVCTVFDMRNETGSAANQNVLSGYIHLIRGMNQSN